MYATELLVFLTTLLALSVYYFLKRPKNFPPGPQGWPVLGNVFQFGPKRHLKFLEWRKTYGDIVGIYFGPQPAVVLNNYKHIREAFGENVNSGRVVSKLLLDRNLGGNRGLLFSEGQPWMDQRRFCLKNLRDFGFGKKSMEGAVMEEVNELIASFRKQAGQPITTQNRFNIAVLNALWSILTSDRFSHDDPRLNSLIRALTTVVTKRPLSSVLADLLPPVYWIRKKFPFLFTLTGQKFQKDVLTLIRETVKQHQDTLQEDAPRDFIDVYLIEMSKTTDSSSSFYKKDGELGLLIVLLDLFVAGAETTSTTLTWTFLIMARFPEVQEKVFAEIKKVVGLSRHVSLTDRPQLLYMEATIMEIMRYSSLVPNAVPHKAMENIEFHGYSIPKGTMIMGNLYSASRDKGAWGDPENFRPERFLSPDGASIVRNEAWMPFSIGKRICLGESLAKDELFLFVGNLFQTFQITTVSGEPEPSLEPTGTGILIPEAHSLVLSDRSK